MEAKLIGLGVETFKMALYLSMPMLMAGLLAGLAISIFQATTQINEMTLSFVPKNHSCYRCSYFYNALDDEYDDRVYYSYTRDDTDFYILMTKTLDLSSYSSLKIGPKVDVKILQTISDTDAYIIGGCNNLLFANTLPKLAQLGKEFDFLHIKDGFLHIGAATPSGKILSYAKKIQYSSL